MDELLCPACGKSVWYPITEWESNGYGEAYPVVTGIECMSCNKEYVI